MVRSLQARYGLDVRAARSRSDDAAAAGEPEQAGFAF
jgi:hypothetical protein